MTLQIPDALPVELLWLVDLKLNSHSIDALKLVI